jgi:pSer/pThr/pTyr-binding forkhead associated (FHA) protein
MGVSKLKQTQKEESKLSLNMQVDGGEYGSIVVIENVFHFKQVLPLRMGDNTIGRYQKGNPVTTPIETVDPSVDLLHCVINVSRDKRGKLKYVLRDTNSNTGTFVDNVEIPPRERRVIEDGQLFTIGATSIILRSKSEDDNP